MPYSPIARDFLVRFSRLFFLGPSTIALLLCWSFAFVHPDICLSLEASAFIGAYGTSLLLISIDAVLAFSKKNRWILAIGYVVSIVLVSVVAMLNLMVCTGYAMAHECKHSTTAP